MAIIKSGATATQLTIDVTSTAARATLYDTAGNVINPVYSGYYMARIEVIPATTLTDGTTYWAMRNTGAKTAFIRYIALDMNFTGTAAASRSQWRFERFSAATPTAGTSVGVVKRVSTSPSSSVTDVRFAPAGLTTTSVSFETSHLLVGVPNQLTANVQKQVDYSSGGEEGRFVLATGEGLAIRAYGTIVAGAGLVGGIWWDER